MTAALGAERCDYCPADLGLSFYLRAVGIEDDAIPVPQPIVKAWCGDCLPTDRMDAGAQALLTRALTKHARPSPRTRNKEAK